MSLEHTHYWCKVSFVVRGATIGIVVSTNVSRINL